MVGKIKFNICLDTTLGVEFIFSVEPSCRTSGIIKTIYKSYNKFTGRKCNLPKINLKFSDDDFYGKSKSSIDVRTKFISKNVVCISRLDFVLYFDFANLTGESITRPNIYSFDTLLRVLLSCLAVKQNGFFLHSTGILRYDFSDEAHGYIFAGGSSSGKSTIARNAYKLHNLRVFSDELVLVMKKKSNFVAYSTPFWGELRYIRDKEIVAEGEIASQGRIAKIFYLNKLDKVNSHKLKHSVWRTTGLNYEQSIRRFLPNVLFFLKDKYFIQKLLNLATKFCKVVPAYNLYFSKQFSPDEICC